MRRYFLLAALGLLLGAALPALAQSPPSYENVRVQNYAPTGPCTLPNTLVKVTINPGFGLYQCLVTPPATTGTWQQYAVGSLGGLTLTTNGSSGAATLIGTVLNVPNYAGGSTPNAFTAAASGGAAPGTTFNGSAAVTFDYHSFGALGLPGGTMTGPTAYSGTGTAGSTLNNLFGTSAVYYAEAGVNGFKCDDVTDDTAAMNALLAKPGGGVIFEYGTCLFNSAMLTVPYQAPGGAPGYQPTWRITGAGSSAVGTNQGNPTLPPSPSILDLQYTPAAGYAKIYSVASGVIEIDHVSLVDNGSDCGAFFKTVNTTPHIHDVAFSGTAYGASACNDGVILGGHTGTISDGPTGPYQGYKGYVRDNHFDKIQHTVALNYFANGVTVADNFIASSCGSSTAGDGAITVGATSGDFNWGNYITGNYIEVEHYSFGIWAGSGTSQNFFSGNINEDPTAQTSVTAFSGGGLNDMTSNSTYLTGGISSANYIVQISSTGTPDQFEWKISGGSFSSPINITGANQTITGSIVIKFAATTGHTTGNNWTVLNKINGAYLIAGNGNKVVPAEDDSYGPDEFQGAYSAGLPTAPATTNFIVATNTGGAATNFPAASIVALSATNAAVTGTATLSNATVIDNFTMQAGSAIVNPLLAPQGTQALPGYSFAGIANYGWFWNNMWQFSAAGNSTLFALTPGDGFTFRGNFLTGIRWNSGSIGSSLTTDTGIDRAAAGWIRPTTGTDASSNSTSLNLNKLNNIGQIETGGLMSVNPATLGTQILTTPAPGSANWTATTDCSLATSAATCTFSAGTASTISQAAVTLASPGLSSRWYAFTYTMASITGTPNPSITTAFASASTPVPVTAGTNTIYFQSAAAPGAFTITTTLTTGQAFTISAMTLKPILGGTPIFAGGLENSPVAYVDLSVLGCSTSVNVGRLLYCADCKNFTDDTTGTFDSAAASGGHGTNVACENGAWRVH